MPITLQQLLDARDARRELQQELIRRNPGKSLVMLTVNIPGSEKRTPEALVTGRAGVEELMRVFDTDSVTERDLPTGFEAWLLTPLPPDEAKSRAISIEQTHPLGRLMDIDVFQSDGTPIARAGMGEASRRCLICGEDARVCMRTFAHSQEELHSKIHSLVHEFLRH